MLRSAESGRLLIAVLGALVLLGSLMLTGCSTLRFYQQAVTGQVRLLTARQDVDRLLAQEDLDPDLRAALLDSQTALDFARTRLELEPDGRYGSYVDLKREFVVWNLVVAPVDSVEPLTWCFPVAGCVSYRGYFKEKLARDSAADFDPEDFDTYVGGVPAYSTLGWFNDPLMSSFIHWPRAARSELLFHELAHGKLYVGGDTEFNESFATYVADYALPLFLQNDEGIAVHRRARAERARFNALLLQLRARLERDFAGLEGEASQDSHRARQQRLAIRDQRYAQARACVQVVREEFADERWLKFFDQPPNMARLSLVGAYQRWVGAFRALHLESASQAKGSPPEEQLRSFYEKARALSELAPEERRAQLLRLSAQDLKQRIKTDSDRQYANDIQCEALADHSANGHLPG